ncbi:hypothetical protein QN277_000215 [Acacia crassicarpa]|uniref:Uncharacterized protein n=1 Tax=Acacia crassicarpa TaxID=499986 RepID=A0AAE1N5P0_9FABA|nr:hypothetical protein QN277_000215 [Acacia crassicarpa]
MSSILKRSQEETVQSVSKHPHEDTATHSKLSSLASSEYHIVKVQDSFVTKEPSYQSHGADRQFPLHSVPLAPSSSNDSHLDHPAGIENSLEVRDFKDSRDLQLPNCDAKSEKKRFRIELTWNSLIAKSEKDVHVKDRDGKKDVRYDRDSHHDFRGDIKIEKDGYVVSSSQLNWKELIERHKGKRHSDAPSGGSDTRHVSHGNTKDPLVVGKEGSTAEKDYVETHEAVGENKDLKSKDRSKEKDRKRKDAKRWDCGEKEKQRSDCRTSTQVAAKDEGKDSAKEDRDVQMLEREKRDLPKDKESLKEREKDHIKRDLCNGIGKTQNNEKERGDASVKIPEQGKVLPEQKKPKDHDSWKNVDPEPAESKIENNADLGGRPDKRGRGFDKELEEGSADGDGAAENEKEVYNHGLQRRKRVKRSRGSPQVANCEPHFRSHGQDNEGSQGKAELPVYKVGECIQELIKLWKEYESPQTEKNGEISKKGPTLEIRIPAEHVTATNPQVRGTQLWGTDVYTYDSDLVAVLMHTGYCQPSPSQPPMTIQELCATIRVLPPQERYISTLRNKVRSRVWCATIGCSYQVERCCIVKKGGGTIDLEPCLALTSIVEPTLAPVTVERTITTRSAASNVLRQQRFVQEVRIQYNLCNEPWIKYSISIVADKGVKKPLFTSARLKKGEVLYLETHSRRYELCFAGEKKTKFMPPTQMHEPDSGKSQNHLSHSARGGKSNGNNVRIDVFRWSRCKKPLPQKMMLTLGIPLPLDHVEVLEEDLDWEDVQWSQTGVWIAGIEYTLARVHFLSTD